MSQSESCIGVFDSGVGGLTVLRALVERLPHEHTVYLGDTARVPYGTKSPEVVIRYALRVVDHLARFPLKALVVACNTASAVALPALRERLQVPVLGVVEPGAAAALEGGRARRVAVLATEGTVRSRAYERALHGLAPATEVRGRPCPLFVPLAEEGLTDGPITQAVCEHYLAELRGEIDTAILGCTHYPLLRPAIEAALGPEVRVVDGGQATAQALATLLDDNRQSAPADQDARRRFFFTDAPAHTAELCARFFGDAVEAVEVVDL